jgi:hypothetical protein
MKIEFKNGNSMVTSGNLSINFLSGIDLDDIQQGAFLRFIDLEQEVDGFKYKVKIVHDFANRTIFLAQAGYEENEKVE